jgi:hypothetical protein
MPYASHPHPHPHPTLPRRAASAALVAVLAASPALAQRLSPAPTPGLWENTNKITLNGVDLMAAMRQAMEQSLKELPPAQRAQAMQALQAQAAVIGGTTAECLSPAMARELTEPRALVDRLNREEDNAGCRYELVSASGSTVRLRGQCKPEDGWNGAVQGSFTLNDAKRWSARFTGSGRLLGEAMPGIPNAQGEVQMVIEMSGRWVAASCGSVKPER